MHGNISFLNKIIIYSFWKYTDCFGKICSNIRQMVKVDVPLLTPVNSNTTDKDGLDPIYCGDCPVHCQMSGITSSLHLLSTPAAATCLAEQSQQVFRRYQMLAPEHDSEPIRGPTQRLHWWLVSGGEGGGGGPGRWVR